MRSREMNILEKEQQPIPFGVHGDVSVWKRLQDVSLGLSTEEINLMVAGGAMLYPTIAAFFHVLAEQKLLHAFKNIIVTSASSVVALNITSENKHGIVEKYNTLLQEGDQTLIDFKRWPNLSVMDQQVLMHAIDTVHKEDNLPDLEAFAALPPIFATMTDSFTGELLLEQLNAEGLSFDQIKQIVKASSCIPIAAKARRVFLWPIEGYPDGRIVVDGGLAGTFFLERLTNPDYPKPKDPNTPRVRTIFFSPLPIKKNTHPTYRDRLAGKAAYCIARLFLPEGASQAAGRRAWETKQDIETIQQERENLLVIAPTILPGSPFETSSEKLRSLSKRSAQGIHNALKLYVPD